MDADITEDIDEDVLKQWEQCFDALEDNGIIIYFVLYYENDPCIDQALAQHIKPDSAYDMHAIFLDCWNDAKGKYNVILAQASIDSNALTVLTAIP